MNLETASYTDFVGTINQTNVPPGAFATLNRWAVHSFMTKESFAVELGCTTGFSLRELSRLTGCRGVGVDISAASVKTAQENAAKDVAAGRLSFQVGDGGAFVPAQMASHVIVGAALGFFPDPAQAVKHITSYLQDGGYLLASPFWTTRDIPAELVQEARAVLGITPTLTRYKDVMRAYRGLRIAYEERLTLEMETEEELQHYCESTTRRYVERSPNGPQEYDLVKRRLYHIKDLCNRLRPYQAYSALILQYDRAEYPHRYVELF